MKLQTVPLILMLVLTTGCHSLTQLRVDQEIACGDERALIGIWINARGYPMSGGDSPVADATISILFYPLDVITSTIVAVRAPFDPRMDITWGPIGALAGITLPWLTLVPYVLPPYYLVQPAPKVELDAASWRKLMVRVRAGDGLAAYREIVPEALRACNDDEAVSVVVLDDAGTATAWVAR